MNSTNDNSAERTNPPDQNQGINLDTNIVQQILIKKEEEKITDWYILLFISACFVVQGAVLSFFSLTIPILIAEQEASSYTDIGIVALTPLPFSFKFIIAPFVDTYHIRKFGRRKTYLLITEVLIGAMAISFRKTLNRLITTASVWPLFLIGFFTVMLITCHTLALQGWSVKALHPERVRYTSSAHLSGQMLGQILGFYLLVPITSKKFCRDALGLNIDKPLLTIEQSILIFGIYLLILATIWVIMVREKDYYDENPKEKLELKKSLKAFLGFWHNRNLRYYMIILLTQTIGFESVEAVFNYVLVKKGYPKELLTIIQGYLSPIFIIGSNICSRLTKHDKVFSVYLLGQAIRVPKYFFMLWFAENYEDFHDTSFAFWAVNAIYVVRYTESTIRRTALFAFDYHIADKVVTSTFLSITHSFYNAGVVLPEGLFPILLDHMTLMSQAMLGTLYNCIFFYFSISVTLEFQQKHPKEFSISEYIMESSEKFLEMVDPE